MLTFLWSTDLLFLLQVSSGWIVCVLPHLSAAFMLRWGLCTETSWLGLKCVLFSRKAAENVEINNSDCNVFIVCRSPQNYIMMSPRCECINIRWMLTLCLVLQDKLSLKSRILIYQPSHQKERLSRKLQQTTDYVKTLFQWCDGAVLPFWSGRFGLVQMRKHVLVWKAWFCLHKHGYKMSWCGLWSGSLLHPLLSFFW